MLRIRREVAWQPCSARIRTPSDSFKMTEKDMGDALDKIVDAKAWWRAGPESLGCVAGIEVEGVMWCLSMSLRAPLFWADSLAKHPPACASRYLGASTLLKPGACFHV